ncbi:MAG: hypothetical protein JWM53_6998 [bacterium]|jgi:hypothetical protein|nr:hypothetical protein [bacterium]
MSWRAVWRAPILSPQGLVLRAALIAVVYGALHLAGARADVAFLSGTSVGGNVATLLGCAYLLFHFAFVLVAPILVIASLLLGMTNRGRGVY